MDLVTILRELGRRRVLVGAVLAVSILIGVFVGYRVSPFPPKLENRQYEVGIATVRLFVDTPGSQVVEVSPKGSDTLGLRASLLSSLMVDGEVKAAIARRTGLRSGQLKAFAESTEQAPDAAPSRAVDPKTDMVLRTRVLVGTNGEQLPIIEVEAQAPDADRASKLAEGAVAGLGDYLGRRAVEENVAANRRLHVSALGAAEIETDARGPGHLLSLGASVLTFLFGCAAILAVSRFAGEWRRTAAGEPGSRDVRKTDPAGSLLSEVLGDHRALPPPARSKPPPVYTPPRDPSARL